MMLAHVVSWTGTTWVLLGVFVAMLVAGIMLGAAWLARSAAGHDGGARRVLGERLARGEISTDEYRDRLAALGGERRPTGGLAPIAAGLIVVGLIGALVVGGVGPGSGGGFMHHHMMGGMGSMMGGGQPGRSGPAPSPGAREVTVRGDEFSFRPAQVRARRGETVNLIFDNAGMMFHTLTVGELGIDLRAGGGTSISGALTAERAGSFAFICAVPGHAEMGMRGQIVVT